MSLNFNRILPVSILCLLSSAGLGQVTFSNEYVNLGFPSYLSEHSIGVLDLDGDKKDDIAVLDNGLYFNVHYQNLPGQTFTVFNYPNQPSGSKVWGLCGGDVNSDQLADIIYGGSYDSIHIVMSSSGALNYTHIDNPELVFMQGMSMADIDTDGDLDLFVCHDDGPSVMFLGDGSGNFIPDTNRIQTNLPNGSDNSGNYGSIFTDYDNDGDIDLFVAKCKQGVVNPLDFRRINVLFENDGNGVFTENAAAANLNSGDQSWAADFADIDNDGDLDVFVGQHSTHSQILLNDGNGVFTDVTATSGIDGSMTAIYNLQNVFEDFDNDGWIDLLVCGSGKYLFCYNNGDGTFDVNSTPPIAMDINSFALGDLNSDGFIDMYASPGGYGGWSPVGGDSLFLNDGNSNNYLTVTLEGVMSNFEGIGAKVELYGPWGIQVREIRSGVSYGIQNSLNAHFGMGSETAADSVYVRWPSGHVDVLRDVQGNQFFHITEGDNPISIDEVKQTKLTFFPNPTTDKILLSLRSQHLNGTIEVYNTGGQKVIDQNIILLHEVIDVQHLKAGNYTIVIRKNGIKLNVETFIKL